MNFITQSAKTPVTHKEGCDRRNAILFIYLRASAKNPVSDVPLICFDKFFECLDGSVGGELLELLVVFDLVKFKIVADGAENGERNAVHIAHMTHGAALHFAAERAKLKGDVFALPPVATLPVITWEPSP